jgi:hypothetical protein
MGWVRINATLPDAMIRLGNGVACDFGTAYGLWYWTKTGGWIRWNSADPDKLLALDIDNDGTEELIASFAGYGLYTYEPATMGWVRINATLPDAMIRLGNGVACDFGTAYGLWYWTKTGGWIRWNSADPDKLLALDIDNDGTEELIASFAGYGLYTYEPATMGWVRINATLPDAMIRLGNGVACDFGTAYGLWYWAKTGGWVRWNASDPDKLLAVDIDNDGTDELVASFTGYGLFMRDKSGAWPRLNAVIPENMHSTDFVP